MAEFNEDKLSALDIAKTAGLTMINPLVAYGYDPNAWHVGKTGISADPFTKNILINNPLTKKLRLNRIMKTKGFSEKKAKAFMKSSAIMRSQTINTFVSKMGMQFENNVLSLSKTPVRKMEWHQKLKQRSLKLRNELRTRDDLIKYNTDLRSKYHVNLKRLETLNVKLAQKESKANPIKRAKRIAERDALLANQAKYNMANSELDRLYKIKTFGNLRERAQLKVLRVAGGAGVHAGRALAKAGVFGMKLGAIGAISSLMYEGIKMITNPIAQAGVGAVDNAFNNMMSYGKPDLGGSLNMGFVSYGAATERQRAIQAISKSRINGRSILGQEAQYLA